MGHIVEVSGESSHIVNAYLWTFQFFQIHLESLLCLQRCVCQILYILVPVSIFIYDLYLRLKEITLFGLNRDIRIVSLLQVCITWDTSAKYFRTLKIDVRWTAR